MIDEKLQKELDIQKAIEGDTKDLAIVTYFFQKFPNLDWVALRPFIKYLQCDLEVY